ncbi:MAG: hypothetical protein KAS40_18065, partial [Desulfobacterales bacterium]|nr:hypothetical protein [Desulfobacterales bacterium]
WLLASCCWPVARRPKPISLKKKIDKINPSFVDYMGNETLKARAHFDIKKIMPYYGLTLLKGVRINFL